MANRLHKEYRRSWRRVARGAIFLLAALFCARPAPAQPVEVGSFGERIEVEVVNVDVTVSDARGRPLTGLGRGDFALRVDGEPMEITHFQAIGKAAASPGGSGATPAVKSRAADGPGEPLLGDPPVLVIYLDDVHLDPNARRRSLDALTEHARRRLAAGGQVMLVAHDQDHYFLRPPIGNRAALDAALAEIAALEPSGAQRRHDQEGTLRAIAQTYRDCEQMERPPCVDCLRQMIARARSAAQVVEYSRGLTLSALHHLVAALGVVDGRKELLLATGGLAVEPGLAFYDYILDLCPGQMFDVASPSDDNFPQLDLLAARANANRVTLHALGAEGMHGPSAAAVDFESRFLVPSPQNDALRVQNVQDSLLFLAGLTGGRAILDTNQPAADLARLDEARGGAYTLGFSPGHAAAGRTHRMVVELRHKKGEVGYRHTYFHKELAESLAEKTLGAVLLGVEKNVLDAAITVGEPVPPRFSDLYRVSLEVHLPATRLTLLDGAAERTGQIKAVVAAPTRGGEIEVRHLDFGLRLPAAAEDEAKRHEVRFGIDLHLPTGEHAVGIGLYDALGGTASFLGLEIAVKPAARDSSPAPRAAPDAPGAGAS